MRYILAVLIVLFSSYSDIFLYRINIIPVAPASFILPFFILVFLLRYPIKDFIDIIKSHSFKLLFVILILSIIYAAISKSQTKAITEEIVLNTITLLLYVFTLHFFRTENKKLVTLTVLAAFAVLAGSVLYDFFIGLPRYDFDLAQNVRKGGFGENPNRAASGIKFLALSTLLLLNKAKNIRYLVVTLMVISIFLTFSRSGTISVILILILGTINNWSPNFQLNFKVLFKSSFRLIFLFGILYVSLLSFSEVIKQNFPAFTRGAAGKSNKSVIAEDTGKGGGRGDLFLKYLADFMDNPIGHGTSYSADKNFNPLNTHNYYLYLAINFGILAIVLYLVYIRYGFILSIKLNQFYYFIFFVLFIFEGLISHSVFHERPILVSLAFFDSRIYQRFTG